jgi:hypothetical protein
MAEKKANGAASILAGLAAANWLFILLVLLAGFSKGVKKALAIPGHHLIGKVILSYICFVVVRLATRETLADADIKRWTLITTISIILMVILIAAIYAFKFALT